ncbi:MAG: hypothetical protein ACJ8GN_14435 [Longimicrobiaceae bacterium]
MTRIRPSAPKRSGVDALAVLNAFGTGSRTVGFAIFTWLLIVSATDAWAVGDRASTTILSLFAVAPAFFTYRCFRRFRTALARARAPYD